MPFKPIKLRDYEKWIRQYGWELQKAGMDWKLLDQDGKTKVANIIITHPGREVIPLSIKKTKAALTLDGLED